MNQQLSYSLIEGSDSLGCIAKLILIDIYLYYSIPELTVMFCEQILFLQRRSPSRDVGESDRHWGEHQAGEGDESAGEL